MTDITPIKLEGVRRAKAHLRRAKQLHDDQGRKPRPVPLMELDPMTDKQVYTVNEAAELLSLNVQTVRRWCRDGELQAAKIGRHYRISRPALEDFWRARGGGELFADEEGGADE